MKCVSLFSGAGGLDLGLKAAGFDILAAVEQDADCCNTLRANFRTQILESPLSKADLTKIADSGTVDLLAGGPPCQPFSKSAQWTTNGARGLLDQRSDTIGDYVDAIRTLRPRAFLLENVQGFIGAGGLRALQDRLEKISSGLKYTLHCHLLNAADYGVPQKRKRVFVVGLLGEESFEFPEATHALQHSSAWDALHLVGSVDEDLTVKGRWAALLPSVPPGDNYLWHTSRGGGLPIFGWRTRYWSFLYKLAPNLPSPTLVASPSQNSGPFHWDNRLLSTAELAALQTFPATYTFSGARASRQRQIGNAVPPLLAEHMGRAIMRKLEGKSPKKLRHSVTQASMSPPTPKVMPVSPQYLPLIGDHRAHPGTGLGPKPRSIMQQAEAPL